MSRVKKLMRRVPAAAKTKKIATAIARGEPSEPTEAKVSKTELLPDGNHLASVVSAFDRKAERVRIGGKWIHVSYLVAGECLRALQIANRLQVTAVKKPAKADRLLWAIGKAVEKHIRDTVIQATGREKVFGKWSCVCKNLQYTGLGNDRTCQVCGELASDYSEFLAQDESSLLSGSPDLLVMVGGTVDDPVLMVVEIKSIKVVPKGGVRTTSPDFHNLSAPSRTHALQALLYRELLNRLGIKTVSNVVVYYAAKDYVMCDPYKAFNVESTDQHNAFSVDALFGMATDYAMLDDTANLLPRMTKCATADCSCVKSCPVGAQCFMVTDTLRSPA